MTARVASAARPDERTSVADDAYLWRVSGLMALWAALLACVVRLGVIADSPFGADPMGVTALAVGAAALALLAVGVTTSGGLLGFVGVYGLYLALAHLGAVASQLVVADPFVGFQRNTLGWIDVDARTIAVALSGVGIGAFGLAASIVAAFRTSRDADEAVLNGAHRGVYFTGLVLLSACAAYMVGLVALGVLPIFGGYGEYRMAMALVPGYPLMLLLLGVGLTFALAAGSPRRRRLALLVFALPASLLLLSGNRGEVLYPLAAGIAVLRRRGMRVRTSLAFAGVLAFFVVIPVLRQVRTVPLASIQPADLALGWTDPFVELGYTLRPFVETVTWRRGGEDHANGATFVIPIRRVVGAALPFVERPPLSGSRFSFDERLPAQGYSVLAESYFNFGIAGVALIPALIGVLLVVLGDSTRSVATMAFGGAVMAAFVNAIRNAFVFVPGHVVLIAIMLAVGLAMGRGRSDPNATDGGAWPP